MANKSNSTTTIPVTSGPSSPIRIVVHPYASALPLGCFAFGVGNALTSAFYLHWIPVADQHTLAIMLLAFVAPLELIPCIMAFLSRDTGGATAMGIFSAAWVVQGIELLSGSVSVSNLATGIFLLMLSLYLIILAVVTFSAKPLLGILLSLAVLRSLGASLMQFGFIKGSTLPTAIFGFLVSLFAVYSGLGFLLEDIYQKPMAMTFRRGKARAALDGNLQEQLTEIAHEAGVRNQL